MRKTLGFQVMVLMICFMIALPALSSGEGKNGVSEPIYVYVTKKGEKYHCKCCQSIKRSNKERITLSEAKRKKYEACSLCEPPK